MQVSTEDTPSELLFFVGMGILKVVTLHVSTAFLVFQYMKYLSGLPPGVFHYTPVRTITKKFVTLLVSTEDVIRHGPSQN